VVFLSLLAEKPSYGYKLIEDAAKFGLSPEFLERGVAYRILRRLEALNLVESAWDTSQESGMPRRVYTITQEGIVFLKRWSEETENVINSLLLLRDRIKKIIDER